MDSKEDPGEIFSKKAHRNLLIAKWGGRDDRLGMTHRLLWGTIVLVTKEYKYKQWFTQVLNKPGPQFSGCFLWVRPSEQTIRRKCTPEGPFEKSRPPWSLFYVPPTPWALSTPTSAVESSNVFSMAYACTRLGALLTQNTKWLQPSRPREQVTFLQNSEVLTNEDARASDREWRRAGWVESGD